MDLTPGSLALSELDEIKVVDAEGQTVGELIDVVASCGPDESRVTGFFIEGRDQQLRATWSQVAEIDLDADALRLSCRTAELEPASLRGDELALVESVLDNQILDMRARVFVRAQDVVLEPHDGDLVVTGVDASSGALARRFGLGFLSRRLPRRGGDFVPWEDVNLIALRLSRLNFVEAFAELAELHPADIADVVGQVGPRQRAAVLAALNTGLAADTLQEMQEELRAAALQEMPVARAAAVMEEIEPDEAADILSTLPDELAQELLARLSNEREEDLRELVRHPEHTAGSLMTTELVELPADITAGRALELIRSERPSHSALTCIHFVGDDGGLVGVATLRDLVLADPAEPVSGLLEEDVVTVAADVDEAEVGRLMVKYDLLVIPVLDEQRRPIGIVTLDDALDAVLPSDWTQRLPRIFR